MALTAMKWTNPSVTGAIRLVAGKSDFSLFVANTGPRTSSTPPFFKFETTLTPVALDGHTASFPQVSIPQPLSPPPAFDLGVVDGTLNVAYQVFSGGSNDLYVAAAGRDGLEPPRYGYGVRDCGLPRLVRDTSGTGAKIALATATLDYQEFQVIGLGKTDLATGTTPPLLAETGVAFGDLSGNAPPDKLSVIYKTGRKAGPLSVGNSFLGGLWLGEVTLNTKVLSTPKPLLPEVKFAEFDVAYYFDAAQRVGIYCLLATTGDGIPLLAAFDAGGNKIGAAFLPFGDWTNVGAWASSPTIIADPSINEKPTFNYALILMEGDRRVAFYTNSVSVTSSGIVPPQGG